MEISLSPGRLMGAFNAGVADEAWGDLPMPVLSNPRVRFWFTERGWRAYGLRVAAEARASGRAFRVIRRKNPSKSMVVYRDDWQVALLPDRDLADHECSPGSTAVVRSGRATTVILASDPAGLGPGRRLDPSPRPPGPSANSNSRPAVSELPLQVRTLPPYGSIRCGHWSSTSFLRLARTVGR